MTQEAIRMRTGEDDRADVRIAVCTIDQLFQLLGDLGIEQRMRASVDTSDKYPGVALDGNVPCGLRVHFTPSLSLVQSRGQRPRNSTATGANLSWNWKMPPCPESG